VNRRSFPFIVLGVLFVSWAAFRLVGLLVAGTVVGGVYWVSLRTHPRIRHGACNGSGERRHLLFPWTFHRCQGCSGGRMVRHGARVMGSETVRGEHQATTAARKTARQQHRWR
jgi:hypothetical protein